MRLRATLTIPGDTYGGYSAFLEHAGDLTGGQDPVALDRPSLSMARLRGVTIGARNVLNWKQIVRGQVYLRWELGEGGRGLSDAVQLSLAW